MKQELLFAQSVLGKTSTVVTLPLGGSQVHCSQVHSALICGVEMHPPMDLVCIAAADNVDHEFLGSWMTS